MENNVIYVLGFQESYQLADENVFSLLRERLERYQKYMRQHPEYYGNKSYKVELPARFTKMKKMYMYFIPFSKELNIDLEFLELDEKMQGDIVVDNLSKLQRFGVKMAWRSEPVNPIV